MRTMILLAFVLSNLIAHGQSTWRTIFRIDPEQTNGAFILDQAKATALGIDRVEVEVLISELMSNGAVSTRTVETLVLDDNFYALVDPSTWGTLNEPHRVHYRARGYNTLGVAVVDVQSIPNGHNSWPELCRETCDSNIYAYTLIASSNGAEAVIEIHDGVVNGAAARVYVKQSDWADFQAMFHPFEDFGFSGQWFQLVDNAAQDVIYIAPPQMNPPSNARDYMGYFLEDVTEPVYGVKKGRGPWRTLDTWTGEMAAQGVCGGGAGHLRTLYNDDEQVENALWVQELQPLSCMGMLGTGGGLSWGTGYDCTHYNFYELPGVPVHLPNAVVSYVGCVTTNIVNDMDPLSPWSDGISGVQVNHWTVAGRSTMLNVPFPTNKDPKLAPVPRTELSAGLYQYMIILDDGRIMNVFQEVDQSLLLNADFANFTHINIYPVPVKDETFAVDFDLAAPMDITMSIINNTGTPYLAETLSFELAGRNKHVVKMQTPWPAGIYHAIFQFSDGSTTSRTFTVATPN